jgi:septum site-determining protein MinD
MTDVIVVTSGKGGVGKTTATANLGAALASLGRKVVLADADVGLRNLDLVMGLENRVVYNLVDVIEGVCALKDALIQDKRFPGLFLLPAAQTRDKDAVTPEQMVWLCGEIKALGVDFILLDCPAGVEQGFRNAAAPANRALVVVTPETPSVRDADKIIGLLYARGIEDYQVILNRVRVNMVKRGEMLGLEDVVDVLGVKLAGVVPDDENVIVCANRGESVLLRPKSEAARAYGDIARRLLGEEIPLGDLEKSQSVWRRVRNALAGIGF